MTTAHDDVFSHQKPVLTQAPILITAPPFALKAEACSAGLSAVLEQGVM